MLKQFILIFVVLMSMGIVSAGEIVTTDQETIFLYGQLEDDVRMYRQQDEIANYNKTVCINSTVIEGEIKIISTDSYLLEYNFIYDINESSYISKIVELNQTKTSSSLFSKTFERTLIIDGITVASYEVSSTLSRLPAHTFYFCLVDGNVRYGNDIHNNISLAFTQLNYIDQQTLISTSDVGIPPTATHKYITVGFDANELRLSGITGWAYNCLGTLPLGIGEAIQGLIFMPFMIIQYTINFLFSFLFLIINNWWYALLLLEIFCIIPALTHRDYPSVVSTFIDMHVKIFYFMYHKVILPLIAQILRLVEVIRNLFRV